MALLLGLIFPFVIILLPIFLQIFWGNRLSKKGSLNATIIVGVVTLFIGLFTPIVATFLSVKGLTWKTSEPTCATGAVSFFFFGYMGSIVAILMAIINGIHAYKARKSRY